MKRLMVIAIFGLLLTLLTPIASAANIVIDTAGTDPTTAQGLSVHGVNSGYPEVRHGMLKAGQDRWFWFQSNGNNRNAVLLDYLPGNLPDFQNIGFDLEWPCIYGSGVSPMFSNIGCVGQQDPAFPNLYKFGAGSLQSGQPNDVLYWRSAQSFNVPIYIHLYNHSNEDIWYALGNTYDIWTQANSLGGINVPWLNPPTPGGPIPPDKPIVVSNFPPAIPIVAPPVTDPATGLVVDPIAVQDGPNQTRIIPRAYGTAGTYTITEIQVIPPAGFAARGTSYTRPISVVAGPGGAWFAWFPKGFSVGPGNPLTDGYSVRFYGSGVGTVVKIYYTDSQLNTGSVAATFQAAPPGTPWSTP